jgi:pimeloyl-ACP methyl ester carboxylesterase
MKQGRNTMGVYVFVSGGGFGGFIWRQVATHLRAAGHEVFTPTLTGLGERVHLAHSEVDLETHIQDILEVLHYEDLHDVVLVGHSYGGVVITGVAERAADRLRYLVYLDAFIPQNGQAALDLIGPDLAMQFEEGARKYGEGWRVPPLPGSPPWMTSQPIKSLKQPLTLKNPVALQVPRAFIYCTKTPLTTIRTFAARARAENWHYRELPTGHMPMLKMPGELSSLLLEFAS